MKMETQLVNRRASQPAVLLQPERYSELSGQSQVHHDSKKNERPRPRALVSEMQEQDHLQEFLSRLRYFSARQPQLRARARSSAQELRYDGARSWPEVIQLPLQRRHLPQLGVHMGPAERDKTVVG